jgi:hypothetical protein
MRQSLSFHPFTHCGVSVELVNICKLLICSQIRLEDDGPVLLHPIAVPRTSHRLPRRRLDIARSGSSVVCIEIEYAYHFRGDIHFSLL